MTDQRSGDPHPDSLPEDQPETAVDSPPAAHDDAARTDIEGAAAVRGEAVDDGQPVEPHDAQARFSETDGPDDIAVDPRVN
ncbi:hypothetical protein [Sphingomonas jeddahensis]|uniref:Uncharacterized protein n=1 Tax=Sphingomonas jeddahensis TaxID=1915074 RepID=A0A1V2ERU2_9SPHN|nr:hypothetical protein [Sphingomonas jeddahensis]ONF94899.1 hypothetical protein SPHI_29130 [Sphingomonas jeddahensis]